METLRLVAAKLAMGDQPSEELPRLATEALLRGLDSPALAVAAGARPSDVRDARDVFVAALRELGIDPPDEQQALWLVARDVMERIVEGTTNPVAGAEWIWMRIYNRFEKEGDLRVFIGLASTLDDHPSERSRIEAAIREAAADLLRRQEPRTWVKLQARQGESPIRAPFDDNALSVSDLAISDRTRSDLSAWAKEYDNAAAKPGKGPSVFASVEEATDFTARGTKLVEAMQAELGPDWHVEYMPTPIAFPPGSRHRSQGLVQLLRGWFAGRRPG